METQEEKIEKILPLLKGLTHKEAEDILWKVKKRLTLVAIIP